MELCSTLTKRSERFNHQVAYRSALVYTFADDHFRVADAFDAVE